MTLPDPLFWRGRRVLVTGHTGFRGGWLALWLTRMGATVTGYGFAPAYAEGIYGVSGLDSAITPVIADIRHASVLRECLNLMRPEVVIHLATQNSPVRAHADPAETYDINVLGTVRLLEELRRCRSVRAAVITTSDTVYSNDNAGFAFNEHARLGGTDALAASKAAMEFAGAAFRPTAPRIGVATVRTGNLIGGGDWNDHSLMADAAHAFNTGETLQVRSPGSVSSWQYVLDALGGALQVAERLYQGDHEAASAWNFGAGEDDHLTAQAVADHLIGRWNEDEWPTIAAWEPAAQAEESRILKLDTDKARTSLGWVPRLNAEAAVAAAVAWYKAQIAGEDMARFSIQTIEDYLTT